MFKNAIFYRLNVLGIDITKMEAAICNRAFIPCGSSQEKTTGWVPPRGKEHGALLDSIGGQWILKLMTETKSVPSDIISRKAAEQAVKIEHATGRKPGKKETKEIKEDIKLQLLPHAFSKRSTNLVWIDVTNNLMVIEASSQTKADDVAAALLGCIDGLGMRLLLPQESPVSAMSRWLITQEPPQGFTVDRECELKACDDSKATIKYGRHPLDIDEVCAHVSGGKQPVKLALTWNDRVSFVLTDSLQLKQIKVLDIGRDQAEENDAFDADVVICTSELGNLIPALIDALGGELQLQPELPLESMTFGDGPDPLYDKAVEVVTTTKKASISLVQRHLKIGFNRAARLMEQMETSGLVSAMDGSGSRKLLTAAA